MQSKLFLDSSPKGSKISLSEVLGWASDKSIKDLAVGIGTSLI